MKKLFVFLSLFLVAIAGYADVGPAPKPINPPNIQHPIMLFNSTHGYVTFHFSDDAGHMAQWTKAPVPMLPTILFTRVSKMWHHNLHVYAVLHHIGRAPETVNCQPFDGNFS